MLPLINSEFKSVKATLADPRLEQDHPELLRELENDLYDAYGDAHRLSQAYGVQQFVKEYVRDAHDELSVPEGDRTEPLCSCDYACPLTKGNLPAELQMVSTEFGYAPEFEEAAQNFISYHSDENVLSEAMSAWTRERGDIFSRISRVKRRARAALTSDDGLNLEV